MRKAKVFINLSICVVQNELSLTFYKIGWPAVQKYISTSTPESDVYFSIFFDFDRTFVLNRDLGEQS